MDEVVRLDSNIPILQLKKTDLGYKGMAHVTKVGVFYYMNGDGTLRRELRHPDEVFAQDSLDSLKLIPITVGHPKVPRGLLTTQTSKQHLVGMTGDAVSHDEEFVDVTIAVNSDEGIKAIELDKKEELSCGYTYKRDNTPGEYDGVAYDCIQREIRYNHLAIVKRGRAGKKVRINVATDGVETLETIPDEPQPKRSTSMLVKVNIDGIEYEVPAEVKRAFERAQTALDESKSTIETLQAEKSTLVAAKDTAEDLLKQEKAKYEGEALVTLVKNRVQLEKVATDFVDDETAKKVSDMTDEEIKKVVIISRFPKAALDEAEPAYINARFDSVVELGPETEQPRGNNHKLKAPSKEKNTATDSNDARAKMISRFENAYKDSSEQ